MNTATQEKTPDIKTISSEWFETLRNNICAEFEKIEREFSPESTISFERTPWNRPDHHGTQGGGGIMAVMRGNVFEKVGVNVSTVHGTFSEEFRQQIPGASKDGEFWASGVSLVAHMKNPRVPSVHMNTRQIITTDKQWFGGGADLTPTIEFDQDNTDFHTAFKQACDQFDPEYYPKYKKWCDEYFFLPHRNEARGIGGIFYDYHNSGNWDQDFAFTQAVGNAFLDIFPQLVRRHMLEEWTEDEKEKQLVKRGRYAEFNLLYDRGTQFGLKTGGNTEAILMSLPPEAKWP